MFGIVTRGEGDLGGELGGLVEGGAGDLFVVFYVREF